MELRNIAIIAHVDHGKTTLVDWLLKQSKTFRENELMMSQDLIMDSNDQERERGITILAKNTAVSYNNVKINIIDTPGHSDFGGEVERTLNMADGALLLVDAQEGPMPQTKFVLKKALELGLRIIVIVNKVDKKDANVAHTISRIYDLFLELATKEEQLDFPIIYAIGREGKSWLELPENPEEVADLTPIFDTILSFIPKPQDPIEGGFQLLVSALDWDSYKGKYTIGRVRRGSITPGASVALIKSDGKTETAKVDKVFVNQGLKRVEASVGEAGDIVALTGIPSASIGDTISDPTIQEALPGIKIEEPTLSMSVGPNTSPFLGREGKFLTGRQILERIQKELQTNTAMRFRIDEKGQYVISGRGELHLSVFLETLRREGFEIEVGKPSVITKEIDGVLCEPIEELTIDVENDYEGAIKSEIGKRRGMLISQEAISSKSTRLVYEIPTRSLIGLRGLLLSLSKGTAITSSIFLRYEKSGGSLPKLRKGVLISSETGKAVSYGLNVAQKKGPTFVPHQTEVYKGMIIGLNGRDEDVEINVCKEKQLTNNRSSGEDGLVLTPHVPMTLEQCLGFIENDELLEITPTTVRMRKKILDGALRQKAQKQN